MTINFMGCNCAQLCINVQNGSFVNLFGCYRYEKIVTVGNRTLKAYLRLCHLGQFFMEPSDYYDAPINKVLHFIRSVGLIKGCMYLCIYVCMRGGPKDPALAL
jgi:hypothetical protein